MKRRLCKTGCLLVCVLTLLSMITGCQSGQEVIPEQAQTTQPQKDIVILYTNDIHCSVDGDIGYAGIAALKKQYIAEGNDVVLVDAGDAIQGDTIGLISKGENIIRLMNATGYDLAVPGNHEFDYGALQFEKLTQLAEYPYLACNLTDAKTGELVFDSYRILDLDGVKVAFVGIMTPDTPSTTSIKRFEDENGEQMYDFGRDEQGEKLFSAVQTAVDAARAEGAEYVIAIGHLGMEKGIYPWGSADVINNTTGIDALIDGHSHTVEACQRVKNRDGDYVLCTQTGTKLERVGMLMISKAGNISTGFIQQVSEQDADVAALLDTVNAEFEESMKQIVGYTDAMLTVMQPDADPPVRIVRNAETNLGDLITDAYRETMGADVALMNGGGIRDNIAAGNVTMGDLQRVMPFGNQVCMIEVTGQQLLDALEVGLCLWPEENGSFMHVSGLTYQIDTSVDSHVLLDEDGMFVSVDGDYRAVNVTVGDEPLDPERSYKLAGIDYMLLQGGSGLSMFEGCKVLRNDGVSDLQVVVDYITENLGGVIGEAYAAPFGSERITAKDN